MDKTEQDLFEQREQQRQEFIERCTQRDMTSVMPTEELLQRLDITLGALKEAIVDPKERRLGMVAQDCLSGALIRLSQAYSHPAVSRKVYELVSRITDIKP
ncbi:MAG TPA: hypothetical protein VKR06_46045 [Ktedonosporobacter sp.]|nr:hypothetical protein [Ktedonosporobacter sp.]